MRRCGTAAIWPDHAKNTGLAPTFSAQIQSSQHQVWGNKDRFECMLVQETRNAKFQWRRTLNRMLFLAPHFEAGLPVSVIAWSVQLVLSKTAHHAITINRLAPIAYLRTLCKIRSASTWPPLSSESVPCRCRTRRGSAAMKLDNKAGHESSLRVLKIRPGITRFSKLCPVFLNTSEEDLGNLMKA